MKNKSDNQRRKTDPSDVNNLKGSTKSSNCAREDRTQGRAGESAVPAQGRVSRPTARLSRRCQLGSRPLQEHAHRCRSQLLFSLPHAAALQILQVSGALGTPRTKHRGKHPAPTCSLLPDPLAALASLLSPSPSPSPFSSHPPHCKGVLRMGTCSQSGGSGE